MAQTNQKAREKGAEDGLFQGGECFGTTLVTRQIRDVLPDDQLQRISRGRRRGRDLVLLEFIDQLGKRNGAIGTPNVPAGGTVRAAGRLPPPNTREEQQSQQEAMGKLEGERHTKAIRTQRNYCSCQHIPFR